MDFLIHWPPGPVVATVQCQGLNCLHRLLDLKNKKWLCDCSLSTDVRVVSLYFARMYNCVYWLGLSFQGNGYQYGKIQYLFISSRPPMQLSFTYVYAWLGTSKGGVRV